MVGNQKTKQLDGGQTRDHCSHPGLLPCLSPLQLLHAKHKTGFSAQHYNKSSPWFFHDWLVTKHLIHRQQPPRFHVVHWGFFLKMYLLRLLLRILICSFDTLTPGRRNLKIWHFSMTAGDECAPLLPSEVQRNWLFQNKVIFNLKLQSFMTKPSNRVAGIKASLVSH